MTEGIVLAGGYSSRAKANKMALIHHGKPLILSTIESMRPHVSRIIVVSGHHHGTLRLILNGLKGVDIVKNEAYDQGMFSSVKTGMAHTEGDVFIIPGDVPTVDPHTYKRLLDSKGAIRVPVHKDRKGHPIFISGSLRDDLLKAEQNSNLKAFRDKHGFEGVRVDDPGILIDIDTREDYLRMTDNNGEEHKP